MIRRFIIVSLLLTTIINISCIDDNDEIEMQNLQKIEDSNTSEIHSLENINNIEFNNDSINIHTLENDGDDEKWGNTKID